MEAILLQSFITSFKKSSFFNPFWYQYWPADGNASYKPADKCLLAMLTQMYFFYLKTLCRLSFKGEIVCMQASHAGQILKKGRFRFISAHSCRQKVKYSIFANCWDMNTDNLPKPHTLSWQSCTSGEVLIWNFPKIAWHQNYPHHQWLLGCCMTLLCPRWQSSLHQADQWHQAWLQSAAALPSAPASAWPDSGSQLQKSKNILFAKHWHLDFNKEMKHRS